MMDKVVIPIPIVYLRKLKPREIKEASYYTGMMWQTRSYNPVLLALNLALSMSLHDSHRVRQYPTSGQHWATQLIKLNMSVTKGLVNFRAKVQASFPRVPLS